MIAAIHNAVRSSSQACLNLTGRLKGIELALFLLGMLCKLIFFNNFIHVRNMEILTSADIQVAIGTLGLMTFWTLWLPLRTRIIVLILLSMLLTGILYADLIYYRYFQDLISVPVLLQAGQVGALGDSIGTLLEWKDLIFFVDWPLLIVFLIYLFFLQRSKRKQFSFTFTRERRWPKVVSRLALSLLLLAISLMLVVKPIEQAKKTWAQGVFVGNWWNLSLYNVTGLYGFHGYDLYRYAAQHWLNRSTLTTAEQDEALTWLDERGLLRGSLASSDPLFGAYKGSNVIMVQAEALHQLVLGRSYLGQEITPVMNRLQEQSASFRSFYHQTANGRTSDADFAAHCSMQPSSSGSAFIRFAHHDFDCLPALLKSELGYQTSVYHAYDGGFWNRNTMYDRMNYDNFYSKKHYTIDEPLGWSLGDKSFFRQSMQRIAAQQQPFYSFLITLSSHHPYTLPKKLQELDLGELNDTLFGDYLQSVHYVDAALGELIAQLKQEGLWETTLLVVYGDHDNSIKDFGPFETFLGQPLSALERHQAMKQVPLIIHLPDDGLAGLYEQAGGQLDLAPTLMHLLGLPSDRTRLIGMPLLTAVPLPDHRVVFRNGAYTDGTHYYVPSADGAILNGTCYDLSTGQPGEAAACAEGAEAAREELNMSDRIVEFNLLSPKLH